MTDFPGKKEEKGEYDSQRILFRILQYISGDFVDRCEAGSQRLLARDFLIVTYFEGDFGILCGGHYAASYVPDDLFCK